MNDYRITYKSKNFDELQTCIVTERNETAARKRFNDQFKSVCVELILVDMVRENTCATKDQEREAVEKIRALLADLGPQSYVATALDGCLEIAECNIENDFADSWKGRAACQERDKNEAQNKLRQEIADHQRTKHELESLHSSVESMRRDLEEARRRAIPAWLYKRLFSQAQDELAETRDHMRELADTMADCSDHPETAKFRNAVTNYQAAREHAEVLEQTIAGLEDIEPPAIAAGVTEAGE